MVGNIILSIVVLLLWALAAKVLYNYEDTENVSVAILSAAVHSIIAAVIVLASLALILIYGGIFWW